MDNRIDYAIEYDKERRWPHNTMTRTTMQRKMIRMTSSNRTLHREIISENVDFILSHFQEPIFPRKIMTKRLGYQKEVFSKQEAIELFRVFGL